MVFFIIYFGIYGLLLFFFKQCEAGRDSDVTLNEVNMLVTVILRATKHTHKNMSCRNTDGLEHFGKKPSIVSGELHCISQLQTSMACL